MSTRARLQPTPLMSGAEYTSSLRDGRRIILGGEEIDDITSHPLFARGVQTLAGLFDAQLDPATQDVTTYVADDGQRYGTGWLVPTSADDLRRRRGLLEFSTDRTFGVWGRPPDYGPTLAMGFLASMGGIERTDPEASAKLRDFIDFGRAHNQMSTDLIADAQADRTIPESQNPGRLRVVGESAEGVIVYGAKPVASAATQGHWGGIASVLKPDMDPDAMMWAYVPVNAPGITFVSRKPTVDPDWSFEDHPLDSQGEEIDALMLFENVLIPWSHVFSLRNPETVRLYPQVTVFPVWAIVARLARRAQILAATAKLIVEILGTDRVPAVRAEVADVLLFASTLRAYVVAAEHEGALSETGVFVPDPALVTAGRLYSVVEYPRIMQRLRELCGQGLIGRFTQRDLEREDIAVRIDEFLPGHQLTARGKNRFMNFVWDLTCGAHGARVDLFEIVNAQPPSGMRQKLYNAYDATAAMNRIRDYLHLEEEVRP